MQVTVASWPTPLRMFVNVTATSGVAAAWGIHHYLKYSPIGAHFSWMANNLSESKYAGGQYSISNVKTVRVSYSVSIQT